MKKIFNNKYDKFIFLNKISEHSILFKSVFELGNPVYSDSIQTAGVAKLKNKVLYLINYDFFWSLNELERLFVVCHESMHVFFNHISIDEENIDFNLMNVASDIVINETLINHFKFNVDDMHILGNIILRFDNVFLKEEIIKHDLNLSKGFRYIYDVLIEINKNGISNNFDEHDVDMDKLADEIKNSDMCDELNDIDNKENTSNNKDENIDVDSSNNNSDDNKEEKQSDDNSNSTSESQSNSNEDGDSNEEGNGNNSGGDNKSNDDLLQEIKDNLSHIDNYFIENNFDNDNIRKEIELIEDIVDGNLDENKSSISEGGGILDAASMKDILFNSKNENSKWKKIIKLVKPSILEEKEQKVNSFIMSNYILKDALPSNVIMPIKNNEKVIEKAKTSLYFFFDCSGSCIHYKDDFLSIITEIPMDNFNVNIFSFDTQVTKLEIDNKTKKLKNDIQIGGGTRFDILEEQIQNDLKNKIISKYPDLVCVLTDGMGNRIDIAENKQKRWLWLITDEMFLNIIIYSKKIPFNDEEFVISERYKNKISSKIYGGCRIYLLDNLKKNKS